MILDLQKYESFQEYSFIHQDGSISDSSPRFKKP